MTTKLVVPPMPELKLNIPIWTYINRLEDYAHGLAAIAQREAALADELAEALENLGVVHDDCNCEGGYVCIRCRALTALAKHTAARQK